MSDDDADLDALFDQIDEDDLQESLQNVPSVDSEQKQSRNVSQNEEQLRVELEEMKQKMKMMEEMLLKQKTDQIHIKNPVNEPRKMTAQTQSKNEIPASANSSSKARTIENSSECVRNTKTSPPICKRPSPKKSSLSDTFKNLLPDEQKDQCTSSLKNKTPTNMKMSDTFDSSMKESSELPRAGKQVGTKPVADPVAAAAAKADVGVDKCPHSGIRISNRAIAKSDFNCAVATRKFIKISQLPLHFKEKQDVSGDWVTSGVIVRKVGPYKSSKGSDYSIWTLSDLVSLENVISIFLFKDVHIEHRKEQIGTVVSILNPSFMPPKDQEKGKKSDLAFVADNPKKILRMGMATDYAICRHLSKSGQACKNFINRALTQYCDFHVIKVHAQMRNKRIVLSGAFTPSPNQSKGQKIRQDCQAFTHKGSVYYPNVKPSNTEASKPSSEDSAALAALKKKGVIVSTPLISTSQFKSMLKVQSVGSIQLKRSLDETDKNTSENSSQKSKRQKLETVDSFKSFFKKNVEGPKLGTGCSSGDVIDLNNKVMNTAAKAKALALAKKGAFTPNTKRKRHEMTTEEKAKMMERSYGLEKDKPVNEEILNGPSDLLYYRPMDTRKKSSSVFGNKENNSCQNDSKKSVTKKNKGLLSAAFGSIDTESAEGKKLIKAQSINAGVIKEQEIEKTTEYFNAVEKFEINEEKLMNITEMKITVYICSICNTATTKQLPACIEKGHPAKKGPAIRKFFRCTGCSFKTNVIGLPYPDHSCDKCGKTAWVKCSMYHENKGPKLQSEKLVVRAKDVEIQEKFR